MILGLFTDLNRHGGVQRLGRHMANELANYATSVGCEYQFLSLGDDAGMHEVNVCGRDVTVRGFGGNKLSFVIAALKRARRAKIAWFNHPFIAQIAPLLKVTNSKLRIGIHTHGLEVWHPMTRLRQYALGKASLVTCTSDYTKSQVLEYQKHKPNRIETLYPPLDPDFIDNIDSAVQTRPKNVPDAPFILSVSRLDPRESYKGIDTTIRAFGIAQQTNTSSFNYVIVGKGDDRERLEQIANEQCTRPERVIFAGGVSDAELAWLYSECLMFVLPSTMEGLGIVFLEAMARNKPVIGGNAGGTPEVIASGSNGYLVDENDEQQLAQFITGLIASEELRSTFGANSRTIVEEKFLYSRFAEHFNRLLSEMDI